MGQSLSGTSLPKSYLSSPRGVIMVIVWVSCNKFGGILKENKAQVILSALCLPDFVILSGLGTLYRCSLTTMAQDMSMKYHYQGVLQPQGELYTLVHI